MFAVVFDMFAIVFDMFAIVFDMFAIVFVFTEMALIPSTLRSWRRLRLEKKIVHLHIKGNIRN